MVIYSIKDLEKLSGVKAHTIRIWEKRYKLLHPRRTKTNIRFYLDEDLRLILNVALLNRNGIKISHIAELTESEIHKKVAELVDIDESFEGQLDSLTISLLELEEDKALKIVNKNIEQRGFEETMLEVIYPLLDKLAMMWVAGSIKSIHERFISQLIQRKCVLEIDLQKVTRDKCFLIFLPEDESNELSLLFLHYLIKKNGFSVINAGSSVSKKELLEILEIRKPDYIYTILNENMSHKEFTAYLKFLREEFKESCVLISGLQTAQGNPFDESENIVFLRSSQETIDYLSNL